MSPRPLSFALLSALALALLVGSCDGDPPPPAPLDGPTVDPGTPGTTDPGRSGDVASGPGVGQSSGVERQLRAPLTLFDEVPVEVTRVGEEIGVEVRFLAGSVAAFAGRVSGRQLIRIEELDGRSFERVLRPVEGTCEIDFGPDVLLRGIVRDPDGTPLAGATIDFGVRRDGRLDTVESGEDGRFEIYAPSGAGAPLVVHAAGYASLFRVLEVGGGGDELSCWLEPGLRVGVVCIVDVREREAARLHVRPVAGTRPGRGFPFHRVAEQNEGLVSNGETWLEGLPSSCALEVVVEHPDLPGGAVSPVVVRDGVGRVRIAERTEPNRSTSVVRVLDEVESERLPLIHRLGLRPRDGLLAPAAASPGLCVLPLRDGLLPWTFGRTGALGFGGVGVPRASLRFRLGQPIDRVWLEDLTELGSELPVDLGGSEAESLEPGLWELVDRRGPTRVRTLDLILGPATPFGD